jgi:hypothetical protein
VVDDDECDGEAWCDDFEQPAPAAITATTPAKTRSARIADRICFMSPG